ncbi:root hair defective 3 GTP-binding protein-domain-containing protein [Dunaliella salina]|uniref:Root hair defective 3 GTP-binding protein-domain-containing protein n=1 Tax=Dunaliella salina TaxID=3046 RepID=A0ABQ7G2C4_DUNSA|nr:root hair defective 3 GTP-binding protein-domain-containing protein [Dunaliella salina]|eukprot:KAF5828747.1 root hair defective 3 GTP-binding protein-domain-containing protein [Dunaliella salina]
MEGDKLQLIDSGGVFREQELKEFVTSAHVDSSSDYLVVAIMGPQSSGKSTLMNYVFGTGFYTMNAEEGRQQTTMVNLKLFAPDPNRKRTVLLFVIRDKTKTPLNKLIEVMEDDLNKMWDAIAKPPQYEKSKIRDFFDVQYAAMSHYEERHDDFVADATVLRRRFLPDEIASDQLSGFVMDQAWKDLEAEARSGTGEVVRGFNTRLMGLVDSCLQGYEADAMYFDSSPHHRPLHRLFAHVLVQCLITDSLRMYLYEADAMYFDPKVRNAKLQELSAKLWEVVTPAVADQVSALRSLYLNAALKDLQLATGSGRDAAGISKQAGISHTMILVCVPSQVSALRSQHLNAALKDLQLATGSDRDAAGISGAGGQGAGAGTTDGDTSTSRPALRPAPFGEAARCVQASTTAAFRRAFAEDVRLEGTDWDGRTAAAEFEKELAERVEALRGERIEEAVQAVQRQLANAVSGPVISLLDSCTPGVWRRLHAAARNAAASTEKTLLRKLEGFELEPSEVEALQRKLTDMAQAKLENHVREAALTRISRMKDRFTEVFTLDEQKTPRMWRPQDKIPSLAYDARLAASQVLAQLAVIRPPEESTDGKADVAADTVEAAVLDLAKADLEGSPSSSPALDILSADSWPGVREEDVLLQPHEIRTTWREFMSASNVQVQQALSAQQTANLAGSRPLPFWAILAIFFLGWNEFMSLLYNPLFLILGLVVFLFGRTLYAELDVDGEMAKGSLPGLMSLMSKFRPACSAVLQRCSESLSALAAGQLPEELQAQGGGVDDTTNHGFCSRKDS